MQRIKWKKTIIILLDVILGVYLLFAFTDFHLSDENNEVCTKVQINIQDKMTNGFLDAKEIKKRLVEHRMYPLGKLMQIVNTRQIEDMLKKSAFVKTAECYKTQDGDICINITQRMPLVRIKSNNGDDYYLDDNNAVMPNTKYVSNLIIVTGSVSKWFAERYISILSKTIMSDDLWKNQIEQINVLPGEGIELVPLVGNQIVYIGNLPESNNPGERQQLITAYVQKKLERLKEFYIYGLSQAGWNKYSYINLEFDNQIICKKRKTEEENGENQNI